MTASSHYRNLSKTYTDWSHWTVHYTMHITVFVSQGIDSQSGRPVRQPYLSYQSSIVHRLAESIPDFLNVYKYGLVDATLHRADNWTRAWITASQCTNIAELCRTLLSYAVPYWATSYLTELGLTLLSYATPSELHHTPSELHSEKASIPVFLHCLSLQDKACLTMQDNAIIWILYSILFHVSYMVVHAIIVD
jgi:hypothetical protein